MYLILLLCVVRAPRCCASCRCAWPGCGSPGWWPGWRWTRPTCGGGGSSSRSPTHGWWGHSEINWLLNIQYSLILVPTLWTKYIICVCNLLNPTITLWNLKIIWVYQRLDFWNKSSSLDRRFSVILKMTTASFTFCEKWILVNELLTYLFLSIIWI